MSEELKTHVKVFVTRSGVFRARVTKENRENATIRGFLFPGKPDVYEVSIGGESWAAGKGREELPRIKEGMEKLRFALLSDYLIWIRKIEGIPDCSVVVNLKRKSIEIGGRNVR